MPVARNAMTERHLKEHNDGVMLNVFVQPKASRSEIVGIHQGQLKIRLTAPPVEGAANKECIRFLSKVFGIAKSKIEILKGHRSRRKQILLRGLKPVEVEKVLMELRTY